MTLPPTTSQPGEPDDGPDLEAITEALDSGLIMLINLAVLWPRGLALRVMLDDTGAAEWMDIVNFGEYMAGFIDTEEDDAFLLQRIRALRSAELEREQRLTRAT